MFTQEYLRLKVTRPVLQLIDCWSHAAENLLMGTHAQETDFGSQLCQIRANTESGYTAYSGAMGLDQIEEQTYNDIWDRFLLQRPELKKLIMLAFGLTEKPPFIFVCDIRFSVAMARCKYLMIKEPLPEDANDIAALARYWKKYYNTPYGAGTEDQFIAKYHKYVLGE